MLLISIGIQEDKKETQIRESAQPLFGRTGNDDIHACVRAEQGATRGQKGCNKNHGRPNPHAHCNVPGLPSACLAAIAALFSQREGESACNGTKRSMSCRAASQSAHVIC
jgi:hypothetical protein